MDEKQLKIWALVAAMVATTSGYGYALDAGNTQVNNVLDGTLATDAATVGQLNVVQGEAAAAQADATQALLDAAAAQGDATLALSDAAAAQLTADGAVTDAAAAQLTADGAVTDAAAAQATGDQAILDAAAAQLTADGAAADAAAAQATADQEVIDRTALIREDVDGVIHIGADSILIDETEAGLAKISTSDGDDIAVGVTFRVQPSADGVPVPGPGAPGTPDQFETSVVFDSFGNQVTRTTTLTLLDETTSTETESSGGAMIETNGDVTLTDGVVVTDIAKLDYATIVDVCSTVGGCDTDGNFATKEVAYGNVIVVSPVQGVANIVDGDLIGFAVGGPELSQETEVLAGANLTMDGNLTMTGGNVDITSENGVTTVTVDDNGFEVQVTGNSTNLTMGLDDITLTATNNIALDGATVTINGDAVATELYADAGDAATLAAANLYTDGEVATETAARIADVDAEEARAMAAETVLTNNLAAEVTNRIADVDAEEAARILDVNAEEARAMAAETVLTNNLAAEVTNRIADVNAEEAARIADVNAEEARAIAAEGGLTTAINNEINNRIADVNAEESARISADHRLQGQIDDMDDELDAVAAMSAAMSALVPNDRAAGNTQISLGLGVYDGAAAGSLGLFHYVNDNILINAAAAADFDGDGEVSGRAGITFGF